MNDVGYESTSTLDAPPREEKESEEERQQSLEGIPQEKEQVKGDNAERDLTQDAIEVTYRVELTVKLTRNTPGGGKAITVPLLDTNTPNWRAISLMHTAFKSKRNKNILDAILDVPENHPGTKEPRMAVTTSVAEDGTVTVKKEKKGKTKEAVAERNPLTGTEIPLASENGAEVTQMANGFKMKKGKPGKAKEELTENF